MRAARSLRWLALLALLSGGNCLAGPVQPAGFAWRATLELPAGTSLARVWLPPQALLQLQSNDARDLRVFNGAGEPVAFAFAAPPAAAPMPQITRSYRAHPLFSPAQGAHPARGSVQVRIGEPGQARSVWVQIGGAATDVSAQPSTRLNSVIFATQAEKQPLSALTVQAELPANAPVRITAATSPDLAQWAPVALRGRLYRFEGGEGLANTTLELEQPLQLEGRYLRLDWEGQEGVSVSAVTGVVATPVAPTSVRAALPPPVAAGKAAFEWPLAFATPISALALTTPKPNSLVPVRILGRSDAAQPWRQLAQTVVYRLGAAGSETTNPPVALHGASVRWLRVEATHGMELGRQGLEASVDFVPVQLVFLASGSAPFELVAGRAGTAPAHMAAGMLAEAATGKLQDLPEARIGAVVVQERSAAGPLAKLWPDGPAERTLWLWAVLAGGVLLLAGVAWSLLGQLKTPPPEPPAG